MLLQIKTYKYYQKNSKIWNETKYLINRINSGKASEYEKDFMKNKFNSDDNLPLIKILKLHILTVIARSVFQEDSKYYP